jgi:hypothetical protein
MIQFEANKPQILSLKDSSEACIEGFYVLYETSDGRTLALPRPAAIKLNMLDPGPGEEISITKYRKSNEPAEWVVALTPRSEQIRAEQESAEESLAMKSICQMPKSPQSLGTGTYGPVPQVAPGSRKQRETIPWNVAFAEVVRFVTKALNESGEQWSEQSRQDLCSTVLIAAAKAGLLGVWER